MKQTKILNFTIVNRDKEYIVMGQLGDIPYYQHLKAMDVDSALQYIWKYQNSKGLDLLKKEDLEWTPLASCSGEKCKMADKCYHTKSKSQSFIATRDCIINKFKYLMQ